MTARGFSLVEMVVAVAICLLLIGLATLGFQTYLKRYRAEAQIELLLSELQRARVQAICQRRGTRVRVYADRFEVYSSRHDSGGSPTPLRTFQLGFPLNSNGKGWGSGMDIDFKETGLTDQWCSICLDDTSFSPSVDSVVIAATRLNVGKRNQGDDCQSKNITIK